MTLKKEERLFRRRKMNVLLTRKRLLMVFALATLCIVTIPSNAYAADIDNSISSSKGTVSVGQSTTLTCTTVYAMWGLGAAGIPFMSDWLNEIPYSYYARPEVTSSTGSTNGSWYRASAIRASGSVWQQKTDPSWFYGKTTWRGVYNVRAVAASGSTKVFAHGQTTHANTSEGATAYTYIKSV